MKSFRPQKAASVVKQVVSDALANRLQDPRVSPMTTVTRVEVTADFERARVYVSVLGTSSEQTLTMAALQGATGYVQRLLAKALNTRNCPHLTFHLDESLKKGNAVLQMIEESMQELRTDDSDHRPDGDEDMQHPEGADE